MLYGTVRNVPRRFSRRQKIRPSIRLTTRDGRIILVTATGFSLAVLVTLPLAAEVKLPPDATRVDPGGVQAGGAVTNTLALERLSTSTEGPKARTTLRLGSIERSTARGSVVNRTEIGELVQGAEGQDAVSETTIGTVEDVEAGGSITNSVTVGSSVDIAIGDGARACTEIGTMGRVSCR